MSERENRALLARKFGKPLPQSADTKVTMTVGGLCRLLEAARDEERAKLPRSREEENLSRVFDLAFEKLKKRAV